jgi:N-acetylmuramoyl-L-alanine amidase
MKIFLSPSNQKDNAYAYGGTTEAIVCGDIAKHCDAALKRSGFETKTDHMGTLEQKVKASDAWGADLHVPIHTNAHNKKVAGTRLYAYDLKGNGYNACVAIFKELAPLTPGGSENITAQPQLYEVRRPKAPTVYVEVDFHDVPDVAKWLIENTKTIGEAIARGICSFYNVKYKEETNMDNTPNKYAKEAVEKAIKLGIIKGDEKGDLKLHSSVTRQDFFVFLDRLGLLK